MDLLSTNCLESCGAALKPHQKSDTYLNFISSLFLDKEMGSHLEIESSAALDKYFENSLKVAGKYTTHPNFQLKQYNTPDLLKFFDSFVNFKNSYRHQDGIHTKQSIDPSTQITPSTLLENGADAFITGSNEKILCRWEKNTITTARWRYFFENLTTSTSGKIMQTAHCILSPKKLSLPRGLH